MDGQNTNSYLKPNTVEDLNEVLDEKPLTVGCVAYLKSGGPPMTVRLLQDDSVLCEWFDREDRLRSNQFTHSSLTTKEVDRKGKRAGVLLIGELTQTGEKE